MITTRGLRPSRSMFSCTKYSYIDHSQFTLAALQNKRKVNAITHRCITNQTEPVKLDRNECSREFLEKYELNRSTDYFRNLLYKDSNDRVINLLKGCTQIGEVFQIVDAEDSLTPQHLTQAVLVLRDLQKVNDVLTEFQMCPNTENLNADVTSHPSFERLRMLLNRNLGAMNESEVCCCLLYLFKVRLPLNDALISSLIHKYEVLTNYGKIDDISMVDLARWSVVVREKRNIWSLYTMSNYLPVIMNKLERCDNAFELRHIVVCLQKMVPLLNKEIIEEVKKKCTMLLKKCEDQQEELDRVRTVLKCVTFLTFKPWNNEHFGLCRDLLTSISGTLKHVSVQELSQLHRIVFNTQEPYKLLKEIEGISKNWLSRYEESKNSLLPLVFQVTFHGGNPLPHDELKAHLKNYFQRPILRHEYLTSFVNVTFLFSNTSLKADAEICNYYWLRLLRLSEFETPEMELDRFLNICVSYLHFLNSSLYQSNEIVENIFAEKLLHYINHHKRFMYDPATYMKLVLSYLALRYTSLSTFTPSVYENLLDLSTRISHLDFVYISLTLNLISKKLKKSFRNTQQFIPYYVDLVTAINGVCLGLLKNTEEVPFDFLNFQLFSYILRQEVKISELFEQICKRLESIDERELNTKNIRDTLINLLNISHLLPEFINKSVNYCIENVDYVSPQVPAILVNHCFVFGYTPTNIEEFLSVLRKLISRNIGSMPTLSYLAVVHAFLYYNALPEEWVTHIFNVNFLEAIDTQLDHMNYKTNTNFRLALMELNRSVCIEYPSLDVPWFHDKFCKEQIAIARTNSSSFQENVLENLKEIIKVNDAIDVNVFSPYYHHISILVHLNKHGNPVNPNHYKEQDLRKIAFILKHDNSSSVYFKGKGKLNLRIRQLEMLNYQVVLVSARHWNSMYMSEPMAKIKYLKNALWPS